MKNKYAVFIEQINRERIEVEADDIISAAIIAKKQWRETTAIPYITDIERC